VPALLLPFFGTNPQILKKRLPVIEKKASVVLEEYSHILLPAVLKSGTVTHGIKLL
jgi:hypothetical protein